jgi:hypothetical protein
MEETKPETDPLQDQSTGTTQGVPHGVTLEESKGYPDSGRHATESHPIHKSTTDKA